PLVCIPSLSSLNIGELILPISFISHLLSRIILLIPLFRSLIQLYLFSRLQRT
ncbi:hypothetical protein CSUI_006451, partial [Cystoisospora suis]